MRVVVTEKPSVARDLARVLGATSRQAGWLEGRDLRITWCVGHLVELQQPAHYDEAWKRWSFQTLPMVPERFALKLRDGTQDRFATIRKLILDGSVTDVVNACDAGREGELIFRYVYELAGCQLPVRRLWLASLTDSAIQDAWGRLRDGRELDNLAAAARSRSEADWLVGLNTTRAMTCLVRRAGGDRVLSVGRVQTPTLAMIVRRDREIEAFEPQTYWQVKAKFSVAGEADTPAVWTGTWFRDGAKPSKDSQNKEAPPAERLTDEAVARALSDAVSGRQGTVETAGTKRQVVRPPLLYDLTSLQRRANGRYGLSAMRTLEVAQALYERHKLITYPRTDARYLMPDQVPTLPGVVQGIGRMRVYSGFCDSILQGPIEPGKRVVDASEVGDHHAILPTGRSAMNIGLSGDEKRIFDLVARRFLAVLSADALFDRTELIVAVDAQAPEGLPSPPRFRARGRVCVQQGWRAVDPPKSEKQLELPHVRSGDRADVVECDLHEGHTRPPRPHNDASILYGMETAGRTLQDKDLKRAMRTAGLGTPATRAAILQTLLDRGYILREKRDLHATERGRALIDAVPADELKSAELTGQWEKRLTDIAEGRGSRADFMGDVASHVARLVSDIEAGEAPTGPAFAAADRGPSIGPCPLCTKPVYERKPVYACSGCEFVVFKSMAKRSISKRLVTELLKNGRTKVIKGFKSKKGKPFEAGLTVREDGRVGFFFADSAPSGDGGQRSTPDHSWRDGLPAGSAKGPGKVVAPPDTTTATSPVGQRCPACGQGRLIQGRSAWGCDRWRDGCRYTLTFAGDGARPDNDEGLARLRLAYSGNQST